MANFIKSVQNSVKNWWLLLLVGALLIVGGVYTFTQPEASYAALSVVFSILFIVIGIFEIVFSISNNDSLDNWGWMLFFGVVTLVIGVLLVLNPEVSMATLPYYVGFLLLFRSIAGLSLAIDLNNNEVPNTGLLSVMSILGIIFSFVLLWNPRIAGMTVVIWTGLTLIILGIFSVITSFQLRKIKYAPQKLSKDLQDKWEALNKEIEEELNNLPSESK